MTDGLMTLGQIASWVQDARLIGNPDLTISRVHTDTRTLASGDFFVALRGDRFDGHDFLPQISASQGVTAMAQHGLTEAGLSGVQVSDTRQALGQLALGWRKQHPIPLIAVTGSNGKTTVTQMLASILRAHCGVHALSTEGNFNNDIGVPLTLLRLRPMHRMAVLELGMNHPGEIAQLAAWARPTVALVNNAQREHQEFMHTVQAVAEENGAVLRALPVDGVAVFPADDAYSALWHQMAEGRRVITFGERADVTVVEAQPLNIGWQARMVALGVPFDVELHVPGDHNLRNAMAATACALAAGIGLEHIAQGLTAFRPVAGRSQAQTLALQQHAITLVDDTYNANPDSVRAAIDVLARLPGPRMLVLGDMGEVGDQGPAFHGEVGRYARERGIEHLLTHGELAASCVRAHGQGHHHKQIETLCDELENMLPHIGSVLVKGSRFMRMERVVRHLLQHAKDKQPC